MPREEAIDILKANYPDSCYELLREAVDTAIEALKQPERKKGKWYFRDTTRYGIRLPYICIVCGGEANDAYDFCPHCGAKMEGNEDEIN